MTEREPDSAAELVRLHEVIADLIDAGNVGSLGLAQMAPGRYQFINRELHGVVPVLQEAILRIAAIDDVVLTALEQLAPDRYRIVKDELDAAIKRAREVTT